jgi:hypothetical protein
MSKIDEYDFPDAISEAEYCAFPSSLEDDELVLFHATAVRNLKEIVRDGFKIPDPTGQTGLTSVSFAKRSSAALGHAMTKCEYDGLQYCILAVRYEELNRAGIANNASDIHDYTLTPAPRIVGVCHIPVSYEHR